MGGENTIKRRRCHRVITRTDVGKKRTMRLGTEKKVMKTNNLNEEGKLIEGSNPLLLRTIYLLPIPSKWPGSPQEQLN